MFEGFGIILYKHTAMVHDYLVTWQIILIKEFKIIINAIYV